MNNVYQDGLSKKTYIKMENGSLNQNITGIKKKNITDITVDNVY